MAAAAIFHPATTSFGELTLQRPGAIRMPAFSLGRHRRLLIGWAFAACFMAGLGGLYVLDQAAFASEAQQPPIYGGYMIGAD